MAGELSKEELNKKIKNSIKNLQDLKSGDLKTLPKSEEQIKNKGKKKLQKAFPIKSVPMPKLKGRDDNSAKMPKLEGRDDNSAKMPQFDEKGEKKPSDYQTFNKGGDVTVGKGGDYIKDLID